MTATSEEYLSLAAEHWRNNDVLNAGRLIFEHLSPAERPLWAVNILRFIDRRLPIALGPMGCVLDLATRPQDWRHAHDVFDQLRDEVLGLEALSSRTAEQELQLALLSLGETVAKVLYNSTEPPDEFDDDSGWWIAGLAKGIVDRAGRDGSPSDLWRELIRQPD